MRHVDCIIVGQGLAGSCFALQWIAKGHSCAVIDLPEMNQASRIAAGIFNPITGQNLVKTWMADDLFSFLHEFYRAAEDTIGQSFFYPMPLYTPFLNMEEQNDWMSRSVEKEYAPYIEQIFTTPFSDSIHNPLGGWLGKKCGYIHTALFLDGVKRFIKQSGNIFIEASFDTASLKIQPNGVGYKDLSAPCIVFCQGKENNPWFNWLPLGKLKGEIVTIQTSLKQKMIYNRGIYLVPGNEPNEWVVGATYDPTFTSEHPSEEGRLFLKGKLDQLLTTKYLITSHRSGIRPTIRDRRPVIGCHPEHRSLLILNGLGTKGVSIAPYFSGILIQSMENGTAINKEVNIERYKSLYLKSLK